MKRRPTDPFALLEPARPLRKRRSATNLPFIMGGMIVAVVLVGAVVLLSRWRKPSPPATAALRVVSLKALQAQLKACQSRGNCPEDALNLGRLTQVLGVVSDAQNRDLMLIGEAVAGAPPIQTEDLVVALRNAWGKYATIEGNTRIYTSPGCSIDPNPGTLQELDAVGERLHSKALGSQEQAVADWQRVCQQPQAVRVMGIPFDTHFAQVLVKADYDLKKIADGSDTLQAQGLASITQMRLAESQLAFRVGQTNGVAVSGLNRFWFYPDENIYQEDGDTVFIVQAPVRLETEAMHTNPQGQTSGTGTKNQWADIFARNFTALYPQVARERPVYAELESLFRLVAVAGIANAKQEASQCDLSYFLESYPVQQTAVDRSLPGRSAVKEFSDSKPTVKGEETIHLWMNSCGGVDIAIHPDDVAKSIRPEAPELRYGNWSKEIVKGRSGPAPLLGIMGDSTGRLANFKEESKLAELNRFNINSQILKVRPVTKGGEGYLLTNARGKKLSVGLDLSDAPKSLKDNFGDKRIYFDLQGLSANKQQAFDASAKQQFGGQDMRWEVLRNRPVDEVLFAPDSVIVGVNSTPIQEIAPGSFSSQVDLAMVSPRGSRNVLLRIVAKTQGLVQRFIDILHGLKAPFSIPNFATGSPAVIDFNAVPLYERVRSIKQQLILEAGGDRDAVRIEYLNQFGPMQIDKLETLPGLERGYGGSYVRT